MYFTDLIVDKHIQLLSMVTMLTNLLINTNGSSTKCPFLLYKQVMKYTILQKLYVNIIIESCPRLKEGEQLNRLLWPTFEQRYNEIAKYTKCIVKQGHCDHKIGMWRY